MTDLRAALIEAIDDAMFGRPEAEAVFDAVLDTLADRADEWDDAAAGIAEVDARPGIVGPSDYLAVLRGDILMYDAENLEDLIYALRTHSTALQEVFGLPEEHDDGFWDALIAEIVRLAGKVGNE